MIEHVIRKEIKAFEEKENVKVIFVVEAGSRACGLESKNSDYDVRFVYVRNRKSYLKLNKSRDTYELVHTNELDIVGWDLKKFLQLMFKSNPSVYEWLQSNVIYYEHPKFTDIRMAAKDYYNNKSMAYHYYHTFKSHDNRYIETDKKVTEKRYLHAIKSLLSAQWILIKKEQPPIDFMALKELLPPELIPIVDGIVINKKCGIADDPCDRIPEIDKWFFENKDNMEELIPNLESNVKTWDKLNDVFFEIVNEFNERS